MESALKNVPVSEPNVPEGLVNAGGEWFYTEYANGAGVTSIGMESMPGAPSGTVMPPPAEERNRILDLFRN